MSTDEKGNRCALKVSVSSPDSSWEAYIASKIKSPFLVQAYDAYKAGWSTHMLMEYLPNGDLDTYCLRDGPRKKKFRAGRRQDCSDEEVVDWVKSAEPLKEDVALRVFARILLGVAYLHENDIVHGDIATTNIFIDSRGNVKLGDLGLAWKIGTVGRKPVHGMIVYQAPECLLVEDDVTPTKSMDMWALGVLIYKLLVGTQPFSDSCHNFEYRDNSAAFKESVRIGKVDMKGKVLRPETSRLVMQLLAKNPQDRPTCDDVINSEAFKQVPHFSWNMIKSEAGVLPLNKEEAYRR